MLNTPLRFFVYLLIWLGTAACNAQQKTTVLKDKIKVSAKFDEGSIGTLTESPANFLTGQTRHWKHRTSSDDQYYWFYFKLDNVRDKAVTVKLQDLIGTYRGKPHLIYTQRTKPVFSYNNQDWKRIDSVQYDTVHHTLLFSQTFTQASVWIAYAHPYPYSKEFAFINNLRKSQYLSVQKLGTSAESRPIQLITITDLSVNDSDKKVVFITTLQHAGEAVGGFFMEGMVNFLLSDEPAAEQARKKMVFKIVPMMNPDGIFHGTTRFNNNMEDLNQEWDDDYTDTMHAPTEPEVKAVKTWLREYLKDGKRIDLGLDVHSQGQEGEINILHAPTDSLNRFVQKLNKYWPVEMIVLEFSGSLNDCLHKEFNILSGTFEIPQSNINGGSYLTIEDYKVYGAGTVKGLVDYFKD